MSLPVSAVVAALVIGRPVAAADVPAEPPAAPASAPTPALEIAPAPATETAPAPSTETAPAPVSLFMPPLRRGSTRASATLRPFFNMAGPGWGAINDFAVEHYLSRAPLKLFAAVSPLAVASGATSTGVISHARLGAAFATDLFELGLSFGGRYQRFGQAGFSLSAALRLGALDGLSFRADLTYAIVRNYYTGRLIVPVSSLLAGFEVPVHRRLSLIAEAAFSFDAWLFANVGAKHHLGPRGAPGTWSVRGGLGLAWVLDRFPCQYSDPRPCENAAWATGPTVVVGVERRF